ncbi:MAG: hypothetical protein JRI49_04715, partial [Deltaproteobacteria bacterium]|nr:hypothetical protein [Deltaproteobacteria bacterium]
MKNLLKISLLSLCLLTIPTAAIHSNNDTDFLQAEEHYQFQQTGIDDEIYAVLIFTGSKIYFDLFEFEAGDEFIVTSQDGNFIGTWKAADFLAFTYFTAKVETPDETTTTTTASSETTIQAVKPAGTDNTINIWGFVISLPVPLDSLGFMIGGGAYLGKESFFLGFTQRDVTGDPEFGSINPDEGQQESTLTDVTITGRNTTFQDDPPVSIQFNPSDGLTVSNI